MVQYLTVPTRHGGEIELRCGYTLSNTELVAAASDGGIEVSAQRVTFRSHGGYNVVKLWASPPSNPDASVIRTELRLNDHVARRVQCWLARHTDSYTAP